MKKSLNTIPLLALLVFLVSCSGTKRAALAKELLPAREMEKTERKKIAATKEKNAEKFSEEKIDSVIHNNITTKVAVYQNQLDSFSSAIHYIDSVIISAHQYRKNKIRVNQQLVFVKDYMNSSYQRFRRMEMIDQGLTIAEQHLFQLGAFFGPGKFEIPDEKMRDAVIAFSPLLDSLSSFYNRFEDLERTATLRIIGFADGSGFNKESEIYTNLTTLLNDSLAEKETLNQKLSELRAKNIADLMQIILSKKIVNYNDIHKVDFIFLEAGKGENLPSKKITDYTTNDERRRVVLLYWSVLPK